MDDDQKYSEVTKKLQNLFIYSILFLFAAWVCFTFGKYFDVLISFSFIFLILSIAIFLFCIFTFFKNKNEIGVKNFIKKALVVYVIAILFFYILSL